MMHRSRRAWPALAWLLLCAWPAAAEPAAPTAPPPLDWLDLDRGRAVAAESGRPLLIHFTADWCKWCKTMQRETYADPAVATLLRESFVTARVDTDREPRRGAEFGVRGLPTVWFLDADGEPITYLPGYADAETFLPVLRWVATGAYRTRSFADFREAEE